MNYVLSEDAAPVLDTRQNCIPVSVFAARLLSKFGYQAEPSEAYVIIDGDRKVIAPHSIGMPCDYLPNGWRDHMVVYLPAENKILDLTISMQNHAGFRLFFDLGQVDQTEPLEFEVGLDSERKASCKIGDGFLRWEIFPDAVGWRSTNWNFKAIECFADRVFEEWPNGLGPL